MRYVYLLFFLLVSFPAYCQKETIVSADINYLAPDNITPEQAKRNAIRRARMQAMENAFGTKITQHNTTNIVNSNEESNVKFHSISESEVRGEWLETIKESVETKYIDTIVNDFLNQKDFHTALRSGWGSFVGLLTGTILKLICCGMMIYYFIAELV
mgnify:CR=1 FL=1